MTSVVDIHKSTTRHRTNTRSKLQRKIIIKSKKDKETSIRLYNFCNILKMTHFNLFSNPFYNLICTIYSYYSGLSDLCFDPRPEIRQRALQVLFDTLRNHGHHFNLPLWERVFESVLFPIFDYVRHAIDPSGDNSSSEHVLIGDDELDQDSWLYETCTLSLQLVVDLFVNFYSTVNPLLKKVLDLLVSFIKRAHQSLAGIGVAAFVRLMSNAGELFDDDKWLEVVLSLKEAANGTLPDFSFVFNNDGKFFNHEDEPVERGNVESAESSMQDDEVEKRRMARLYTAISDVKCRAAVQLLLIQVNYVMSQKGYFFLLQDKTGGV